MVLSSASRSLYRSMLNLLSCKLELYYIVCVSIKINYLLDYALHLHTKISISNALYIFLSLYLSALYLQEEETNMMQMTFLKKEMIKKHCNYSIVF
jgi:hypothetical protein